MQIDVALEMDRPRHEPLARRHDDASAAGRRGTRRSPCRTPALQSVCAVAHGAEVGDRKSRSGNVGGLISARIVVEHSHGAGADLRRPSRRSTANAAATAAARLDTWRVHGTAASRMANGRKNAENARMDGICDRWRVVSRPSTRRIREKSRPTRANSPFCPRPNVCRKGGFLAIMG